MRLILHHLKKDICCHRLLLALWVVLLILNSLLMRSGLDRFIMTSEGSQTMAVAHALLYALQQLLQIVIVAQLVQTDGLSGTTAFWLTRPISRKQLLLTKSVFVLVTLTWPTLLVECIVMWLNAIPIHHWPVALAELAVLQGALFLLPAMLVASLTPNLARLSVAVLASLVAFFLIHYAIQAVRMTVGVVRTQRELMSNMLLAAILVIGSCIILIVYQYLSRKTVQAASVAIFVMVLLSATMNFWKWNYLTASEPLSAGSGLDTDTLDLVLERKPSDPPANHLRYFGPGDAGMRRITGWFEPVGLPGDFFIELVELQANLRLPDGKIVISSFDNFFPGLVDFYVEGYEKEISKYLEFSQGASVLNKVDRADPARIMLLSVDQETFQRYKNTPGRYEADVEFRAHQYKMTASLPPHAGPRYWGDSGETRILSVVPHPDGWIITMRESKARRWIERKPQAGVFYVLKNRRTKEALLGRSYPTDIFGRFPVLERVVADHSPVYFTTTGVSNFEGSPINEEWLQQAELLRFEIHTIGHFSKSIHAEGFLMASR